MKSQLQERSGGQCRRLVILGWLLFLAESLNQELVQAESPVFPWWPSTFLSHPRLPWQLLSQAVLGFCRTSVWTLEILALIPLPALLHGLPLRPPRKPCCSSTAGSLLSCAHPVICQGCGARLPGGLVRGPSVGGPRGISPAGSGLLRRLSAGSGLWPGRPSSPPAWLQPEFFVASDPNSSLGV